MPKKNNKRSDSSTGTRRNNIPKRGRNGKFASPKGAKTVSRKKRFKTFSVTEYEQLWESPKSEILYELFVRNGVKGNKSNGAKWDEFEYKFSTADGKSGIIPQKERREPGGASRRDVRITPLKTDRGQWYYCTKLTGQRPVSTGLIIPPNEVPLPKEWKENDDWWKNHSQADKIMEHYKQAVREAWLLHVEETNAVIPQEVQAFTRVLEEAGFLAGPFVYQLKQDLGEAYFGSLCRAYYGGTQSNLGSKDKQKSNTFSHNFEESKREASEHR